MFLKSMRRFLSGYYLNQSGLINYDMQKLIYLKRFSLIPFSFIYFAKSYAVIIHLRKGDDTIENLLMAFCLKMECISYADAFMVIFAYSVIGGSNNTSE